MTRPPLAVRCTVTPATRRWIVAAESARLGRRGDRHVTRLVPRRHDRLDLALGTIVLGNADILGAGRCGRDRRRDDALDAGEKASGTLEGHLVGRPIEQSGEERLLGPDEIRDPRLDPRLAHQVVDVNRAALSEAVDPADSLLEHRRGSREARC